MFFKKSVEKDLEAIISSLEMNMSNNYKDAAQINLQELRDKIDECRSKEFLNQKKLAKYEAIASEFSERMKGFTHKDQKPYWN